MLTAISFVWNATRGNRCTPWRSEYLKWRMETYSGMKADDIGPRQFWGFLWKEKWQLMSFLKWTDEMQQHVHPAEKRQQR